MGSRGRTSRVTIEHFIPERAYDQLVRELTALAVQQGRPGPHAETWAVEFLNLAGVWPDLFESVCETELRRAVA